MTDHQDFVIPLPDVAIYVCTGHTVTRLDHPDGAASMDRRDIHLASALIELGRWALDRREEELLTVQRRTLDGDYV